MKRYDFDKHTREAFEQSVVPVGIYQVVDGRVVTLIVSDGLCELFGVFTDACHTADIEDRFNRAKIAADRITRWHFSRCL